MELGIAKIEKKRKRGRPNNRGVNKNGGGAWESNADSRGCLSHPVDHQTKKLLCVS